MDEFEDKTGMSAEAFLEYRPEEMFELMETGSVVVELFGKKFRLELKVTEEV
jgi:hypothetical protein